MQPPLQMKIWQTQGEVVTEEVIVCDLLTVNQLSQSHCLTNEYRTEKTDDEYIF